MAANIKHVGKLINTQRRCVIVFREIPGEPDQCLVVDTDALPDWMHDDVINAVESPGAQSSKNFYEYADRSLLTDGSNMLRAFHARRLLSKHPTSNVMMTPNSSTKIRLDELNVIIAEQTGGKPAVNVPDDQMPIANKQTIAEVVNSATTADEVMDNTDFAKTLISQAEQFEAEAQRLREEAYGLEPSLKPRRGRPSKEATA
jgi:hypothetical protein